MNLTSYAQNLIQTLFNPTVENIQNVSQTATIRSKKAVARNYLGQINLNNLEGKSASANQVEPIIQLWILRLLILLECHRKFLGKTEVKHDEIARALALHGVDDEIEEQQEGFFNLLHKDEDDSSDEPNPEYDAKQALIELKQRHQQAERNLHNLTLPQPLANNIDTLAKQVGLSAIECAILALAVMIHTDRLLDEAADWLGRELNLLKVYWILSVLLGYPEADIRKALSMRSPLAKTGLVTLDSRHRHSDLKDIMDILSHGFAHKLTAESGSPIDWLRDMVVPSQLPILHLSDYTQVQDSLDFLLPYLQQSLHHKQKGVNVFFYGAPGTGKTQLARVLAQQLACPLYEIASEDEDGDPIHGEQRLRAFRTAQAFFQKSSALMVFDEVEDVFNDGDGFFGKKSTAQTRKAWMNRLLEENPAPTFWLGNSIASVDPAFIRRFDWVIELPLPPKAQRESIIRESCGNILADQEIKRLAACEELAPAVVNRATQIVDSLAGQFPAERLATALHHLIDKTLVVQGYPGLNTSSCMRLPEYYDPALINCDAELTALAEGLKHQHSARLCLYGPPGTGKTAYSRWLAEQLDKPLYVKRAADLLSMWVGGTEKNIAHIFKQAEENNAVLLIDEVDSFLQDRSNSRRSWEITAVNEMLTRTETYNGIFIATTNRIDGLDTASLRRFDLKVKFDALKPKQAWKLLKSYCLTLGLNEPDASLQTALQKLDGLTPGDFAALERQHRFRPLRNANALIAALQAECVLKTPHKTQAIGFV